MPFIAHSRLPARISAAAAAVAVALAAASTPAAASARWGDPTYGDPPYFCPNLSRMGVAEIVSNDPNVPNNPERDTFFGFHQNPGWDNWYGYFYGDFRGRPDDSSGWVELFDHVPYPQHRHWNFASYGWSVHGHVKQYIAYYNWTFGGQCGWGAYGRNTAPPYMADQEPDPVVDFWVDSVAPETPRPVVTASTPTSISMTWPEVADRGDGAGGGYFAVGMDRTSWTGQSGGYRSWYTVDGGPRQDYRDQRHPVARTITGLNANDLVCLYVVAYDALLNATQPASDCARAIPPPPGQPAPGAGAVAGNPVPTGLAGFPAWFWLQPALQSRTTQVSSGGYDYQVTMTPSEVEWSYGDGTSDLRTGAHMDGVPASSVQHVYEAESQAGYQVSARVSWEESWTVTYGGQTYGPYDAGSRTSDATPLVYPVEQAQPELLGGGP